jgi:methyltransferase (TIGR00027 family)
MTAIREREHSLPDPYLDDPYAHLLITDARHAGEQLPTLDELHGPSGSVVVRGRLGDEVLKRAFAADVRQAVTLGAGSDTRPWRLPLEGMRYFEIDLPGQLDAKMALLGQPATERIPVEADLRSDWPLSLIRAGFDPLNPTVWVLEGLLHYLDRAQADTLRDKLSGVSARGSWMTGDVPHTAFLTDPMHREFLEWMVRRGSPFVGTFTDPVAWLAEAGWVAEAHLPADLLAGDCSLVPPPPSRLLEDHRHLWYFHARRG